MNFACRFLLEPVSPVPVTVESVESSVMTLPLRMSLEDQAIFDLEWAARIAAEKAADLLSSSQQLALLTLRARGSGIARAVVDRLQHSTAVCGRVDFQELERRGLAHRKPNGYHDLSPRGHFKANEIARAFAIEFGIPTRTQSEARRDRKWWRGSSTAGW